MRLFKNNPTGTDVNDDLLNQLESTTFKAPLPPDYRAFMKSFNGGIQLEDEDIYYTSYVSSEGELVLNALFHLEGGRSSVVSASKNYDFLPKAIVIGDFDGGLIAMSLSELDYGHIYMQFSYSDPEKIAKSFTEFIDGLKYREE